MVTCILNYKKKKKKKKKKRFHLFLHDFYFIFSFTNELFSKTLLDSKILHIIKYKNIFNNIYK